MKQLSGLLECSDCGLETLRCDIDLLPVPEILCDMVNGFFLIIAFFRLCGCELTSTCYKTLASVISSQFCSLRNLDLGSNDMCYADMKLLSDGLRSPCCKLKALGLEQFYSHLEEH